MASPATALGDDDDDEFDWDAAVRAIDDACQGVAATGCHLIAGPSVCVPSTSAEGNGFSSKLKTSSSLRQVTLDKFMKNHERHASLNAGHVRSSPVVDLVEDGCAGDEEDSPHPKIDIEAAKTWIYPVNVPLRDYQFNIAKTALFSNTLVALPTGLGKTLIAAVVMYNYFRWFPEGKIVFAAPSRPLVVQQIEACHKTVGIPQEWTIDLTGQTNPCKRAHFWKSKRVFFVTPQVLEKDIQSGTCSVRKLVCLVIDEAHRATGNYAYCVAIRELMAIPVHFRILGLSATPGAKQETIQKIIDNLHISTLEFRNEDDYDVGRYVHNRKLELLKVPMGNDAVEINNLLVEAIRPFATKLSTLGVFPKRDLSAISPHELVALRDQFRQAPPLGFPASRKGEIEGCFLTLVTLYHVRKLLSSHGVKPAFEMLEEKCKQGPFSILITKNEKLWKAKLLMQQSISHGALSPKLLKLVEVLLDHFKNNDPKKSRVIVFSNFRESVKDILDTLASIGDVVRATQFIGQSSGRTSKGQSQKMQQEVLRKFRSGGYNVLVATSIAEEGLDIMEVDLVICFDANISPLRMIQRMGRTGRKHDGRVVVLACEGTELKGYHRKQANSKAVRKHMHNGGVHSFEFHSSPRMVPHICKPEVQFVEMSIEQFVPRGKKLKDNTETFNNKISCDEEKLISKYFGPFHEGNMWKPSLIAFPCFQAIPSSVHKVKHSKRTTEMLIDTMGVLHGLSIFKADEVLPDEEHCWFLQVKSSADQFLECKTTARDDCKKHGEDSDTFHGAPPCLTTDVPESSMIILDDKDDNNMPNDMKDPHHFLFNADLVSVDLLGRVLVLPVPSLPFLGAVMNFNVVQNESMPTSSWPTSENYQPEAVYAVEEMLIESPVFETKNSSLRGDRSVHPASRDSEDNELRHGSELNPRLTNYIVKGVVPESPIIQNRCTSPSLLNINESNLLDQLPSSTKKSCSYCSEKFSMDNCVEFETSNKNAASVICSCKSSPPIEICVPFVDPTNLSSTEDWLFSSDEAENSVQHVVKFKRLCKRENVVSELPQKPLYKDIKEATENCRRSVARTSHNYKKHIGENRLYKNGIKEFFQEEAEVSSDTAVSADEKDELDSDQFEASFIDDTTDPTADCSHSERKDSDMMAFYRRSLLSQSPAVRLPNYSTNLNSNSHSTNTIDCGSCSSDKVIRSRPTPPSVSCFADMSNGQVPRFCEADDNRIGKKDENNEPPSKDKRMTDNRKRKLDFLSLRTANNALDHPTDTLIGSNLYRETDLQNGKAKNNCSTDELFDDNFYEGLDLDAVEAQATMLLRSNLSNKQLEVSNPCGQEDEDLTALGYPSFNLGI